MPVPGTGGSGEMLLHRASLYSIEGNLENGLSDPKVQSWLNDCSQALSFALIGANSLLDLEAVIVGGLLPDEIADALIERIADRLAKEAPPDFFRPALLRGQSGAIAVARGAGLLPLFSTYAPNLNALLKSHVTADVGPLDGETPTEL
jgi:hypothetical protein